MHDVKNRNCSGLIRMDDCQDGTVITENILTNSAIGGITLKGENEITNNYILDACGKNDHIHTNGRWGPFGRTKIARNIMTTPKQKQHFYYVLKPDQLDEFKGAEIDFNIYWSGDGERAAEHALLVALRERGHDAHSAFADPKFGDPEHGDFTLAPDSPAHGLGIKQLSLDGVGLLPGFPHEIEIVENEWPEMWEKGSKGVL